MSWERPATTTSTAAPMEGMPISKVAPEMTLLPMPVWGVLWMKNSLRLRLNLRNGSMPISACQTVGSVLARTTSHNVVGLRYSEWRNPCSPFTRQNPADVILDAASQVDLAGPLSHH